MTNDSNNPDGPPVWFITGCSTGLGRELARCVLARGARAVLTARDKARVVDLAQGHSERCLALDLDVTDNAQIAAAVAAAIARFGRIDVLVNNAGYGYQAAVEEGDDQEIRAMFDTNVFGLFAMTRAVLPGMRTRRAGHVMNITSVAGLVGYAGSGHYAASKHAVEGWSDSLAAEVAPLGIRVTCIAPGPFRTDFAGRSLRQTPTRIAEYDATAGARLRGTVQGSGSQPGDPLRAVEAMVLVSEHPHPPRHLVLGSIGVAGVATVLQSTLGEIETWRATSIGCDFPTD